MARPSILEGPGCGTKIQGVGTSAEQEIWTTCGDVRHALTDPLARLTAIYLYLADCPDDKPLTKTQLQKISKLYPGLRIRP